MTINAKNVVHGTCNGATINADLSRIDHSQTKKVKLKYAYVSVVTGLSRPSLTGTAESGLDFPKTIPANSTLTLFVHEAAALVAANCASYR